MASNSWQSKAPFSERQKRAFSSFTSAHHDQYRILLFLLRDGDLNEENKKIILEQLEEEREAAVELQEANKKRVQQEANHAQAFADDLISPFRDFCETCFDVKNGKADLEEINEASASLIKFMIERIARQKEEILQMRDFVAEVECEAPCIGKESSEDEES